MSNEAVRPPLQTAGLGAESPVAPQFYITDVGRMRLPIETIYLRAGKLIDLNVAVEKKITNLAVE